jgi:hypothetical protein
MSGRYSIPAVSPGRFQYLTDANDLLVYRAPRRGAACLAVLRTPDAVFMNDAGCDLGKMLLAQKRKDDAVQLQLIII